MKEKKSINIEVGQNIKYLRESAGLTQDAFSELVSLGVKHISAIECGAVGISLSTMRRMCEVLSVPADAILFGASDSCEQDPRAQEIANLNARLGSLPDKEFAAIQEILNKVLEAMATAKLS